MNVTAVFHNGPLDFQIQQIEEAPYELRIAARPVITTEPPDPTAILQLPRHAYRKGRTPPGADEGRVHYYYAGERS